MIRDFFYITLIIFAILAIQTGILRNAIIYLSVFSLLCSVVYLLLGAPDVAIAEAVIGCTLSTILYLVALRKYRIFTVYYLCDSVDVDDLTLQKQEKEILRTSLTKFASSKELQLDFINTNTPLENIEDTSSYEVFIMHTTEGIDLYGARDSYQYEELGNLITSTMDKKVTINYASEEAGPTIADE